MKRCVIAILALMLPALFCVAAAEAEQVTGQQIDTLLEELSRERARLAEQSRQLQEKLSELDAQQERLDELERQLRETIAANGTAVAASEAAEAAKPPASPAGPVIARDDIGDLNAPAVRSGDFPGSFRIPGGSTVSLAIGGFVKTAAIADSDAEGIGADFLPAGLGVGRPDEKGAFSLDSTLSRLNIDARSPVPTGRLRAYLEYDLNAGNDGSLGFKMRHAYGSWQNRIGTLVAGHTWSTMMDTGIMPEGLTEPTVSGVIFQRQSLLRWSQSFAGNFTYHVAIEDSNTDVFSTAPATRSAIRPDAVLGLEYQRDDWHLRLNGLGRRLDIDVDGSGSDSATAWGLALSGHVNFGADKLAFSTVYGRGLGRYLVGLQSNTGGAFDPDTGSIDLRDNSGAMLTYRHRWSDALRSTAMVGVARTGSLDWQSDDEFESSSYGSVNLMWTIQPYLTLGVEYAYGQNETADGTNRSNHRVALGIQVY